MFGFKKKVSEKKQPGLKEYSFIQSKHFRGFKKNAMAVYGIADFPKEAPDVKDKKITFKQVISNGESSYKVFLENTHIGSLFRESAEPFDKDMVDAVYIKYETELIIGKDSNEERIRPRLFIHIKE